jgi:beta-1,4-N-acetylglucosaminyltransferase
MLIRVPSNLAASIPQAEKLRERQNQWPPPNSGEEAYNGGLAGVMDEEMGWVD